MPDRFVLLAGATPDRRNEIDLTFFKFEVIQRVWSFDMTFDPRITTLRRFLFLLGVAGTLAFGMTACGNKVLDYRNAEVVNGKVYSQGDNTPFSGKLTNAPLGTITATQPGFAKIVQVINFAAPFATVGGVALLSECDVHVDDGILDGKAVCNAPESDVVRIEMSFSGGLLDGSFRLNDETGKNVFSEVEFKSGQPDGKQKVYSPRNGKLVLVAPWSQGVLTATEEGYNGNTGKQVLEIHRDASGKLDGEYIEWSPDGTLIHKLTYAQNRKDGAEDYFSASTGKQTSHIEWKDGKRDGDLREYGADGNVTKEEHYADDRRIYSPEEARALADNAGQDAYRHCMAHAQLGDRFSNLSKEEYQQKAQVDCKLEAQAIMQAKLQAPDSNGLVAIMPTAGNGVAPPVTGTKPSPIVSTDSQNGAEDGTDVCVDSWSAAYHKEREAQGLDATVSSDQLGEWQDWCKQGKRPS